MTTDNKWAEETIRNFTALFTVAGVAVSRTALTDDGSVLFEFLSPRKAGVDVYPSGSVVVITGKRGGGHVIYELTMDDSALVVSLVANATKGRSKE